MPNVSYRVAHRFLAATEIDDPEKAKQAVEAQLGALFRDFYFRVVNGGRGLAIEFARVGPNPTEPELYRAPVYCRMVVAPSAIGPSSWATAPITVAMSDARTKESLKGAGVAPIRRMSVPGDKAIALVVKWFKVNAPKLKGE